MAQLIQLADGVMNRMEIEVSRDVIGVLIVCGMLHRAEVVDLHSSWHNHHTAGMLAGSALDAGTSRRQSGLLSPVHHSTLAFGVFLYKADTGFLRHRGNGSGFEHVILAEQGFCIPMSVALILTGKVQVDIRGFISVKAQKGFKGNIMAIPVVGSAALRTVFIRQVKARPNGAVGNKLAVMAFWAHIMRAQWVYLGNTGHGGHKAGTNGTT